MSAARWRERSRIVRASRLWRTRTPETFTEKVRYKMLRDRRDLVVAFADKAGVRDYVERRGAGRYLPLAFGVLDDPEQLRSLDLPDAYVVKPTHGSGAAMVVSPAASSGQVLPRPEWGWVYRHVLPENASRDVLVQIARVWMTKLYGQGPNREWAYSRVRPRVIVEEKLEAAGGGIPDDYKFFVFHGHVRYVQVDAGRFDDRTQDFYTPEWEHLPLSGGPAWIEPPRPRPDRLGEMIALAELLGSETDFVRVDLYLLPDQIVFGELTSYPAGGESPFYPSSFDREFGSHWTVPRRYRSRVPTAGRRPQDAPTDLHAPPTEQRAA